MRVNGIYDCCWLFGLVGGGGVKESTNSKKGCWGRNIYDRA